MSLVFWKRVVKLFSPPKVQDAAEKRKSPSLTPNEPGNQPDALSGESSSAPNTPPANNNDSEIHLDDYQPDDSDTSSVASDTETADTFNDSGSYTSNVVTVSKPKKKKKSKSGSFGRNSGISKHHIKKIREKYLNENTSPNTNSPNNTSTNNTNTSNNNNNNSSSDSSSSEASSDASPPQPPPAQRPKKRRSPSRSGSRRSSSLRKTVLMQEEVKHLMALDDVRILDQDGNTALHRVALIGNYEAVATLCKKAPDIVNKLNKKTPLFCAVERGTEISAVEALLSKGAKVNQKTEDEGWSPLHVAVQKGLPRFVELLLSYGADVNAKDKRLVTPLHVCASMGSFESDDIGHRLLKKKAKLLFRNFTGATPIHVACGSGNVAVLTQILDKLQGNISDATYMTDFKGLTPFHYAAQGGHIECIEILRRELPFVEAWTDDLGLNYTTWAFVRGYLSSDFCVHDPTPFSVDFEPLVNDEKSHDVVFIVEGRPIFAHKVCCYVSPYLAKLIDAALSPSGDSTDSNSTPAPPPVHGSKLEIEVNITVPHKIFLDVVLFIYTGRIAPETDWNQFWHASIKLELFRLQQICEREIGGGPMRDRTSSGASMFPRDRSSSNASIFNRDRSQSTSTSPPVPPSSSATGSPAVASSAPDQTLQDSPDTTKPTDTNNTPINTPEDPQSTPNPLAMASDSITPPDNSILTLTSSPTSPTHRSRRNSGRKRSSSGARPTKISVNPLMDFIHELSLSHKRFVGNTMFHDLVLVCGEEFVYAHKAILQKRCPNFFFIFAKNIISPNQKTTVTVFHFEDITKNAMTGLLEFIYCGCFHTRIEPEEIWVLYNFIIKHGLACNNLKERTGYLFYNSLTPDNLLDIFALNVHGFTLNSTFNPNNFTLDSARGDTPRDTPNSNTPRDTSSNITDPNAPGNRSSTYFDFTPGNPNTIMPSNPRFSVNIPGNIINLPGNVNRNSVRIDNLNLPAATSNSNASASSNSNSNSSISNKSNDDSDKITNSPSIRHLPSHEITIFLLRYASKKAVMQHATKYNKKNPTVKLIQQELRKNKADLEPRVDTKAMWKERRKEVKLFAKQKEIETNERKRSMRSKSEISSRKSPEVSHVARAKSL